MLRMYWPGWVIRQPWWLRHIGFVLIGFACWFGLIPSRLPRIQKTERLSFMLGMAGLVLLVMLVSLVALASVLAMLEPVLGQLGRMPFWLQLGGVAGALTGLAHHRGRREVLSRL